MAVAGPELKRVSFAVPNLDPSPKSTMGWELGTLAEFEFGIAARQIYGDQQIARSERDRAASQGSALLLGLQGQRVDSRVQPCAH